jgi:hypothetical protein
MIRAASGSSARRGAAELDLAEGRDPVEQPGMRGRILRPGEDRIALGERDLGQAADHLLHRAVGPVAPEDAVHCGLATRRNGRTAGW